MLSCQRDPSTPSWRSRGSTPPYYTADRREGRSCKEDYMGIFPWKVHCQGPKRGKKYLFREDCGSMKQEIMEVLHV